MSDRIEETGAAFGKAIADELRAIRAEMATKTDLERFAAKEDLERFATKEDLERFATKEDLERFATKEDLERFATKEDLKLYATKDDLERFATKEDLRAFVRELVAVINAQTLNLRTDLNREFERVGLNIRLQATPRGGSGAE